MKSVAPTERSSWKLYGWWVLFSTIGWAAGPILLLLTMGRGADPLGIGLGIVVLGVLLGLAQWLVLRLEIPHAGWWILATTASVAVVVALIWALLWLVGLLLGSDGLPPVGLPAGSEPLVVAVAGAVIGVLVGAVAGLGQSKALPWHITDVGWWVLASTIGGALDGALVGNALWALGGAALVQNTLYPATPLFAAVGMGLLAALVGPLKGIATGLVLVWLRKNRPL